MLNCGFKYQVQQVLMTSLRWHLSQLQHFVVNLKRGSKPMNFSRSIIHLPSHRIQVVLREPRPTICPLPSPV